MRCSPLIVQCRYLPLSKKVLTPLCFEFFDDRRSRSYGSAAGCFVEALFVLRVGNSLTSSTVVQTRGRTHYDGSPEPGT